MTVTLVEMTHEDLPGVTKTTSLNAYRYGYFPVGWRSADDPEWDGAGTEAPLPHIGDTTQHGGGIEGQYAEITANTGNLAVTGISMTAVPGLVVTIPQLDRPIYLCGHVHLRHSVAAASAAALFAPVGETSVANGRGPGYTTHRDTGTPVTSKPFVRLSAGFASTQWQVFVTGATSGNVIVVANTNKIPSAIWWTPA